MRVRAAHTLLRLGAFLKAPLSAGMFSRASFAAAHVHILLIGLIGNHEILDSPDHAGAKHPTPPHVVDQPGIADREPAKCGGGNCILP
jgi:hypothetical protein